MRSNGILVAFIIALIHSISLLFYLVLKYFDLSWVVNNERKSSNFVGLRESLRSYSSIPRILELTLKELIQMKKTGYIKDYRNELESELWLMPPLYHRVWQYLKYKANHVEKELPLNDGSVFLIKPGQHLTSIRTIAKGVGWNERGKPFIPNTKTIDAILKWLIRGKMIQIDKAPSNIPVAVSSNSRSKVRRNTPGSLITLLFWEVSQSSVHESNSEHGVTGISVSSLKVTKQEINTTTTIQHSRESTSLSIQNQVKKSKQPLEQVFDEYASLHNRLDLHIRLKERESMAKMIAGGLPTPFIITTMTKLYEEKRNRELLENGVFQPPNSFKYYDNAIWEAWRNQNAVSQETPSAPSGTFTRGKPRQPQTPIVQNAKEYNLDEDDEITKLMRKASCD